MASVLNTDSNINGDTLMTLENTQTVTGAITFDRDPNAPFAVSSGSAVVTNLDADKLDGQEGSYYTNASNLNAGIIPSARTLQGQYNAVVYNSTTQSISDATDTAVTFDTEDLDTATIHSTSSNTSRLTVPASQGGLYLLSARIQFASNATGYRQVSLRVNGTAVTYDVRPAVNGAATIISLTYFLNLAAADYVEVYVFQNSTGALNIGHAATRALQSDFRIVRLS